MTNRRPMRAELAEARAEVKRLDAEVMWWRTAYASQTQRVADLLAELLCHRLAAPVPEEIDRWKAKFADQAAILQSADADRIRLVAEIERLRSKDHDNDR